MNDAPIQRVSSKVDIKKMLQEEHDKLVTERQNRRPQDGCTVQGVATLHHAVSTDETYMNNVCHYRSDSLSTTSTSYSTSSTVSLLSIGMLPSAGKMSSTDDTDSSVGGSVVSSSTDGSDMSLKRYRCEHNSTTATELQKSCCKHDIVGNFDDPYDMFASHHRRRVKVCKDSPPKPPKKRNVHSNRNFKNYQININELDSFDIDVSIGNVEWSPLLTFDVVEYNATDRHNGTEERRTASADSPIQEVDGYTASDVLLGKGGATNKHPGNVLFRARANLLRPKYKATTSKIVKRTISQELVRMMHDEFGARFVRQTKEDGITALYVVVADDVAWNKAGQVLREGPEAGLAKRNRMKRTRENGGGR